MSGRTNGHKSHIRSREATARGWSNIPPWSVRQETLSLIEEGNQNFMENSYASLTVPSTYGGFSGTITGDYYTWVQPWLHDSQPYYPPIERVQIIERVSNIINESEVTKVADLRTLFRVYVVNPKKNGKVLMDGKTLIAENENQAMLKAGVAQVAASEGVDIEDLDVYVEKVGTFIRPRKKAEKVRIVKESEED